MNKTQQIEDLAKTLYLNYDMPEEFAKGLAEFLYNEGYRKISKVNTATRGLHVGHRHHCSNCSELACMENYCSRCGAKVIKEKSLINEGKT